MKNNIIIFTIFTAVLLGCSKSIDDFGDMNINPNSTPVPVTSALLTNVLAGIGGNAVSVTPGLYCQYFSQTQYTDASLYTAPVNDFDGFYSGSLNDLQNIINVNSDPKYKDVASINGANANQIALARILKVYLFWYVTDLWGDIPYSQALSGKSDIIYDKQSTIYPALIAELKAAVSQFGPGLAIKGDIIFGGNNEKWIKLANSMRMLMALRLSKVDPAYGKTQFADALATAKFIDVSADNFVVNYPGGAFSNPWFNSYLTRKDQGVSSVITDMQKLTLDPRAPAFGSSNVGIPYGLTRELSTSFINNNPNWAYILGVTKRAANSPVTIISSAQLKLARAEAAQLGWTSENTATLYAAGIKENMIDWGVFSQASFDTYMKKVALNGLNNLSQINTQYYLAVYPNGAEGYSNWRRSGFPVLVPTRYASNPSKLIPRRYMYGTREYGTNVKNVTAAAAAYADNSPDARVWWDK
ncbi:MAG: SusD/RagB family nutrient-binding outer membrane lipoprotein [Chitinophagaceae bacterium]|nr:SusD/RagB family nutrient-binding outer membrane lipoprotein [Chitinophagaceae bacterium]